MALSFCAVDARAASFAATDPNLPWAIPEGFTSPEFMQCGLRCVYLQSVEKVSVKTRHLLQTMYAIRDLDPSDNSSGNQVRMDSILGQGFCDWGNASGAGAEKVQDCQVRWFKTQIPVLLSDRVAIRMNTTSAAQLQNGQQPALNVGSKVIADPSKGRDFVTPTFVGYRDPKETAKRPIATHVVRYESIKSQANAEIMKDPRLYPQRATALYQDIERMTSRGTAEGSLDGVSREDYYKKRKILKDPDDPEAGYYELIETNADGTPKLDKAKYEAALKQRAEELKFSDPERRRMEKSLGNLREIHRTQLASTENEKIYNQVRNDVLGAARAGLTKFKAPTPVTKKAQEPVRLAASAAPARSVGAVQVQARKTGADSAIEGDVGNSNPTPVEEIVLPATTDEKARPYYSVAYPDETLGKAISEAEGDLRDVKQGKKRR